MQYIYNRNINGGELTMRKGILSLTVVLSMVIAMMPTFSLTESIDMLAKYNDGGTYTGGIVGL